MSVTATHVCIMQNVEIWLMIMNVYVPMDSLTSGVKHWLNTALQTTARMEAFVTMCMMEAIVRKCKI